MIKLLAIVAALVLPLTASAACTWTQLEIYAYKVVCTLTTEAAPTLITEGMPLTKLQGVTITAEAANGQTFTAAPAGTVAIYLWNDVAAAWARCRDCIEPTISEASQRRQIFPAYEVLVPRGRMAVAPSGVTVSGGSLTFYLTGMPRRTEVVQP